MTKIDPIIAVKNIEASASWYQHIFGFRRTHGGNEFAVLVSKDDEIILCLHGWDKHQHPTMTNPDITPGNGLILYFRTEEDLDILLQNIAETGCKIEEVIHLNPNSLKREFSIRDPDGYYLTISEYHRYEG